MTTTNQDLLDADIQAEIERPLLEKINKQAAVIEKLQGYLHQISKMSGHVVINNTCTEALAIPTDSKQVLQDWLDSAMGEPVAYISDERNFDGGRNLVWTPDGTPLFKKPECAV